MKVVVFGASGRVGRHLVEQALAAGHEVTAFVRDPAKLGQQHERLRVVQGDVEDSAKVEEAIAGQEMVLSTLGHTKTSSQQIQTVALQHILTAMRKHGIKRLVDLTGAGIASPKDPPSLGASVIRTIFKLLAAPVIEDGTRHVQLIKASDREWVVVRAPRIVEGPKTGVYRTGYLPTGPGSKISYADVAHFMLRGTSEDNYLREAPIITY